MNTGKQYDGPLLALTVKAGTGGGYQWEIMMNAVDHSQKKKLGYKAEGKLTDLAQISDGFVIKVHDADRPVWTAMPNSHRKDIREGISSAITSALSALKAINHVK
jgi:hypothetical protein